MKTNVFSATRALLGVQLRRMGVPKAVLPLAVGVTIALVGAVLSAVVGVLWATSLLIVLMPLYTLIVALVAIGLLAGDPLVELQGSTPTSIRSVQTARAVLLAVIGAAGGLIMFVPLHLLGVVYGDVGWVSAVSPVVGAVVYVLLVYDLAATVDSPRSVTFFVMLAWMALTFFWDTNLLRDPILQRGVPLAVVSIMALGAWCALGNEERACRKAVGVR